MTIGTNTLRLLMDAGLEGDALLAVVASIEADTGSKQRSSNAERQARYRAKHTAKPVTSDVTSNVTESVTSDAPRVGAVRVEDNSQTLVIEPQGKKQDAKRNDLAEFRSELSSLDTERLDALIKHRRAKKGQLTGHAARLFRRDADACGLTLQLAVDTCISRNWITVKPEWLTDRRQQGPPGNQAPSMSQLLTVIRDRPNENQPGPPEDRSSFRTAIPHLRTVGAG